MNQIEFRQTKVLFVSAWWPEQEALAEQLAQGHQLKSHSDSLKSAGPFAFFTTGVGTPRAAAALSGLLASASASSTLPRLVCFVATAGAYDPQTPLNSAHLVDSALWSDGDLLSGRAYLPKVEGAESIHSDFAQTLQNCDAKKKAISTPAITLHDELCTALSKYAELENLEVYGVALACALHTVPWIASLGVSNSVGAQAHAEWKINHRIASRAAQQLIMRTLGEDWLS
ncbi:MAG: hypothetical protein RLZZ488_2024 [Pseudomonadota bacterium]|jgi:nucleoside phosphorylase